MAGGVQATATAIVTNEQVTGFTVTNAGSGYTSAPSVTGHGRKRNWGSRDGHA